MSDVISQNAWLSTKNVIPFNSEMSFILIDIEKDDIGKDNILSSEIIQNLIDLTTFTHLMMLSRRYETNMFLIQKKSLIPTKVKRKPIMNEGYYVLGVFAKDIFCQYFPLIVKCAIAMNNGFITKHKSLAFDYPLDKIQEDLEGFDLSLGVSGEHLKPAKCLPQIGNIVSLKQLDKHLQIYHRLRGDLKMDDSVESWERRLEYLSPRYLFNNDRKMERIYKNLHSLGNCISNDFDNTPHNITLRTLLDQYDNIERNNDLFQLYESHVNFYDWKNIYRQVLERETLTANENYLVDLRSEIAWEIDRDHLLTFNYFHNHPLYELPDVYQDVNHGEDYDNVLLDAMVDKNVEIIRNKMLMEDDDDIELYPALYGIKKLFHTWSDSYRMETCQGFQQQQMGNFFVSTYNNLMTNTACSVTRMEQYKAVRLTTKNKFKEGYLVQERQPINFGRLSCDVEPCQDMICTYLVQMAYLTGIKHLTVEMVLLLFSNIISFTPAKEKPMNVFTGPSGCGKSHVAKTVKNIVVGFGKTANKFACTDEHYRTTRSGTAPPPNPYKYVLGQKLVEEWQSNEGSGKNPYLNNTSIESIMLKNSFDTGKCINNRCKIEKNKQGSKVVHTTDISLDDRTFTFLANGFNVCSSVQNRATIIHVPDLNIRVNLTSEEKINKILVAYDVCELFALIRYHVSEEYNRENVGLTLKINESDSDVDERERELTFIRIENALDEMGFFSREILTQRKKNQIMHFAGVLANMRATLDIYASIHKDCMDNDDETRRRGGGSLADYNNHFVAKMKAHLRQMNDYEKAIKYTQRVVIDPSDILCATTLVIQFTQNYKHVLSTICTKMLDPSVKETKLDEDFLLLENINMNIIMNNLKLNKARVLDESLNDIMGILEEKLTDGNKPYIIINPIKNVDIQKKNDKNYQPFNMYVNAREASILYMQDNMDKIEQCAKLVIENLTDIAKGVMACPWKKVNHLGATNGYITIQVPEELRTAFGYLYHFPGTATKGRYVNTIDFDSSDRHHLVDVHPDFFQARLRTLQKLLVESLGEGEEFDRNGYLALHLQNTELFNGKTPVTNVTKCRNWRLDNSLIYETNDFCYAHVSIFSRLYDMDENVAKWRRFILENMLRRDKFAKNGYFSVQMNECPDNVVKSMEHVEKFDVGNDAIYLKHPKELGVVFVSFVFLEEIREDKIKGKPNMAKTMIEKCLCKHLTDFKTIMFFDRETVYKTQSPLDAVSFVHVPTDDELPLFHTEDTISAGFNSQTGYGECVVDINKKECKDRITFHENHRKRKLALKKLFGNGTILSMMSKYTDKKMFQNELERAISKEVEQVDKTYIPYHCVDTLLPFPQSLKSYMTGTGKKRKRTVGEETLKNKRLRT